MTGRITLITGKNLKHIRFRYLTTSASGRFTVTENRSFGGNVCSLGNTYKISKPGLLSVPGPRMAYVSSVISVSSGQPGVLAFLVRRLKTTGSEGNWHTVYFAVRRNSGYDR